MDIQPDDKKKVEAVLFTTGKLMTLEEIGTATNITDHEYLKTVMDSLKIDFSTRDSALNIQHVDDKYRLNIRKEYGYLANKLLGSTELDGPAIKTLAVIALKNPALQSDVIKLRGNKAYDHIAMLKEQNLIEIKGKQGRTNIIILTPHFYDYFDTAADDVKQKFELIQQELKKKNVTMLPDETKEPGNEEINKLTPTERTPETIENIPPMASEATGATN
ncbi:MAG: SMC-Scp complex subunit ScpB [Nanoarchaeota archaeon]|nr:SMC-Scp complex subunit ScpB [Nanoarchaeota archaeon]